MAESAGLRPGCSGVPADCSGAAHEAVAPPLVPAQDQVQGPLPVTIEAVPMLQRLVDGALLMATPLAVPQTPLSVSRLAEHEAVVPPPEPAHDQAHGPVPLTAEAVPATQRFVVGVLGKSAPFDEPHDPLIAAALIVSGTDPVAKAGEIHAPLLLTA